MTSRLVLLLVLAQDPDIPRLLDALGHEDIAIRDQASVDLVKLGAAALPAVRERLTASSGDLKLRLEAVVRDIELAEKLRKILGPPPTVTIDARDRPLGEVAADLHKQSGVRIDAEDAAKELKVTYACKKTVLWDAVDQLCRSHGGMMYTIAPTRILLRAAPYRAVRRVERGGVLLLIDTFTCRTYSVQGTAYSYATLGAALILPPGKRLFSRVARIEAAEDDKGTDLLKGQQMVPAEPFLDEMAADRILVDANAVFGKTPAYDASELKLLKGSVRLRFCVELRRTLSVEKPLTPDAAASADDVRLTIKNSTRTGGTLKFVIEMTRPVPREPDVPAPRFVLKTSKGDEIPGPRCLESRRAWTAGARSGGVTSTSLCRRARTSPRSTFWSRARCT